jgi:hypothetical protein
MWNPSREAEWATGPSALPNDTLTTDGSKWNAGISEAVI